MDNSNQNSFESSPIYHIDALNSLAWDDRLRRGSQGKSVAEEALRLSRLHGYLKGMAEAHRSLSYYAQMDADWRAMLHHTSEAYRLYSDMADAQGVFDMLGSFRQVYYMLGDYERAISNTIIQVHHAEVSQNIQWLADSHGGLGIIYLRLHQLADAGHHFNLALGYSRQLNNPQALATALHNAAIVLQQSGQTDEALVMDREAYQLFEAAGRFDGQRAALLGIGESYLIREEYPLAWDYYERALRMAEAHEVPRARFSALFSLGQVALAMGDPARALRYFQQAYAIAKQIEDVDGQTECHAYFAQVYEQMGDLPSALQHHKHYQALKSKIFDEQLSSKLSALRVVYETESAQREIAQLHLRNEELEQQHQQEQRYFQQMMEMKDHLISTTSHHLKNPLASLRLNLALLRQHMSGQDQVVLQILKRLETNVSKMTDLVRNILDLAVLESTGQSERKPMLLAVLAHALVLDFQPRAKQANIDLSFDMQAPNAMVVGDAEQLETAMENYISNALKYTNAGGQITIVLTADNSEVQFVVRDTGMGIPPEDLPHLFQRFYRVNASAHQRIEGTGLGLSIVKSIVEQHGGSVWVNSDLNRGSTFGFSLPLYLP